MNESEILKEISKLQGIKPRQEWVISTRRRILGEKEPNRRFFIDKWQWILSKFQLPSFQFQYKPKFRPVLAFSAFAVGLIIVTAFAFFHISSSKNLTANLTSIPEKASAESAEYYLNLATKKLDQLNNQQNKQSVSLDIKDAAINIKKAAEALPSQITNPKCAEKIVKKVAAINKRVKEVQKSVDNIAVASQATKALTTKTAAIIQNNIRETQKKLVKAQIEMLKTRSLNDNQKKLFNQAEQDYQNGLYGQALEKILELTNNK